MADFERVIMNIKIRPAETEEAKIIYDFYRVICKELEYEQYSPLWQIGCYPCIKDIENHIQNRNMYIAVSNNQICSAMAAVNHGEYSSLHLFAVHSAFRGTAVSSSMMHTLLETAKKRNNHRLLIDVVKGNLPAEKIYQKFGFKRIGEKSEYIERVGNVCFSIYEYILS